MRTPLLSSGRKGRPPAEPQVFSASAADNLRGSALMMLSMAAFICNDALMKAVTQSLPLYESIAIRGAMVLLTMVLIARAQGGVRLRVPRGDVWPLALRTVADVISTVFYLLALRRMALADISAIMQALPLADRLYISHVDLAPDGDVHFPPIDADEWRVVDEPEMPRSERDPATYAIRVYERIQGGAH